MKRAAITIYEGVLNDDVIEKNEDGIYTLTYWTYRNAWSNDKNQIRSASLDHIAKAYDKITGRLNAAQGPNMEYQTPAQWLEVIDEIEMEEA